MHTPPDSLPSSPTSPFSPFGAFSLSPLSSIDSESSLSPMTPSFRASLLPRCQARQISMQPTNLPPPEMASVGSLFADTRWTGVNPLFSMWNEPTGFEYMQQQGLTQLLAGIHQQSSKKRFIFALCNPSEHLTQLANSGG